MSVPQYDGGSGGATIQVFRRPAYSGGAVPFTVKVDGVQLAKLHQNETVRLPVAPGSHRIQIGMWSGQGSKTLFFSVQAGELVSFTCAGTLHMLKPIDLSQDGAARPNDGAANHGSPTYSPPPASAQPQQHYAPPAAFQQPPVAYTPPQREQAPTDAFPTFGAYSGSGTGSGAGAGAGAGTGSGSGPVAPAPASAAAQAAQTAQGEPTLGEVRETDTFEEPLGDEVRVIDNRHSATGITRSVKASREWTRTLSVGNDHKRTLGAEIGGGPSWLRAKGSIEAELQRTYSVETGTRHVFEEEITVSVPARTTVRLELNWKRIWQRGFVELAQPDGTVTRVPYQVVVNVTFDQSLRDTDTEPWTAAPGSAAPAAAHTADPSDDATQMITVKPEE